MSAVLNDPIPISRAAIYKREVRDTVNLAVPIILTQVGQIAMMVTDSIFIGRLGAVPLAASSLGLAVFFLFFIVGFGLMTATAPLMAQAYGAKRPRLLRRVVRQGLWAALLVSLPMTLALFFLAPVLRALDQPPEAVELAVVYIGTLKWCLPFAIAFFVLRNFVAALNRPVAATVVMLIGVPVNALFDYALIYGNFGFPRWELFGAGIATSLVNALMFLALLWICLARYPFKRYAILGRFWRPDWDQFRRIFKLGFPIAGMMLLEGGYFISSFFMMGWIGITAQAGHLVALQVPHLTFMVPLGLAQAATVRVGHGVGRGDIEGAYRAGWTAIALGLVFMAAMSVVILLLREPLASVFLDEARPDSAAVLAMAVSLLLFAAIFQAADGVQVIAAGALRGVNDTAVPLGIAIIGYWLIGLTGSVLISFWLGLGPRGIWLGFVFGLGSAAVMLVLRFRALSRRRYSPAMPPPIE
jgi:MATE family multidrug resistance protein